MKFYDIDRGIIVHESFVEKDWLLLPGSSEIIGRDLMICVLKNKSSSEYQWFQMILSNEDDKRKINRENPE
jgi:hypothetical protein